MKRGEKEMLTWTNILDMRDDETYNPGGNSRHFNHIYDQARADVEQLMRFDGINLDCVETPEDEIELYCNKYGIVFDTHGNLIYRKEVR